MSGVLHEVLKIFVGKGDFPAQDALARRRELQGWTVGASSNDPNVRAAMETVRRKIVVANGATAGDCVASVVIRALWGGAARVIVPLDRVMGSYGKEPHGRLGRARSLARRLHNAGLLEDTRLTVTDTGTWKQAKDDFMAFFGE